ncbi:hypothetical protein AA0114_g4329 [Alternaria tenuissima]|nr:hypothetical protein AA0114_g4329 [Alternaria tenuissima]
MAFLAARYLSDMLDEAIRDMSARTVPEDEGSDSVPTVSSHYDTNPSPGADAATAGCQQSFSSMGPFPQWPVDDLMGGCQPGGKLNECDMLNLEPPINVDSALLWDFSLQC